MYSYRLSVGGPDLHYMQAVAPPALPRCRLDSVGWYAVLADSAGAVRGGMINGIMTLSGAGISCATIGSEVPDHLAVFLHVLFEGP